MNEEKRTQWINKDPELTAWWRETGMNKREFARKYAKELDVKIKEKAIKPKVAVTVKPTEVTVTDQDVEKAIDEIRADVEKTTGIDVLADQRKVG